MLVLDLYFAGADLGSKGLGRFVSVHVFYRTDLLDFPTKPFTLVVGLSLCRQTIQL